MSAGRSNDTVRSVSRALSILDCIAANGGQLNLSEIMNYTGLPKATAFRLIRTLENRQYLVHDTSRGKFRLGPRLIHLGNLALDGTELRQVALPIMRSLREKSGETVTLFVRHGVWKVCIEKVESMHEIRRTAEIGKMLPVHVGASGKVLLSGLSSEELDVIIAQTGLPIMTVNTTTDPVVLRREIAEVAKEGCAISKGERETGAAAVGAPIRDHTNTICASLNISGPLTRFPNNKIDLFKALVIEAANDISFHMGCISQRFAEPIHH